MKMSGEEKIAAPREQVWKALNDPVVLKKSIAGCKKLTKESDTEFTATVQAKVGPVKATFNGDVKLSKLKPPESYVLSGQGKGGVAGFAKGKATVKLAEDGDNTILTYDVDAQVGGKLAQIGSRLISSTAKKMANDFFKKFARLAVETGDGEDVKKTAKKKAGVKKAGVKKAGAKKTTSRKKVAANKTASKKAPAKKAAANQTSKKEAPATASAKIKETENTTPVQQTAAPEYQRPAKASPVVPIVLSLLGGAILLFYYLLIRQ